MGGETYFFGVVHNGEKDRLIYLKSKFSETAKLMAIESYLYSKQRNLSPNLFQVIIRLVLNIFNISLAENYIHGKTIFRGFLREVWKVRKVLGSKMKYKYYQERSCTEWEITKKHLALVRLFLESSNDFLVIFESDAIFGPVEEFAKKISFLIKTNTNNDPCWLRLSTGFDMRHLEVKSFPTEESLAIEAELLGFQAYVKPTTNTSCCYMINRKMAEKIVYQFNTKWTSISMEPIDFFYNRALAKIAKYESVLSADFISPPIIHGSIIGSYQSWQT